MTGEPGELSGCDSRQYRSSKPQICKADGWNHRGCTFEVCGPPLAHTRLLAVPVFRILAFAIVNFNCEAQVAVQLTALVTAHEASESVALGDGNGWLESDC